MVKRVIDEKIKQNQELLNEYFEKLDLSNESIITLIKYAKKEKMKLKSLKAKAKEEEKRKKKELKDKENIKND